MLLLVFYLSQLIFGFFFFFSCFVLDYLSNFMIPSYLLYWLLPYLFVLYFQWLLYGLQYASLIVILYHHVILYHLLYSIRKASGSQQQLGQWVGGPYWNHVSCVCENFEKCLTSDALLLACCSSHKNINNTLPFCG